VNAIGPGLPSTLVQGKVSLENSQLSEVAAGIEAPIGMNSILRARDKISLARARTSITAECER